MLPPKQVGRFFLITAIAYAVMMIPWPGVERAYAYLFRSAGDIWFSRSFWFHADGSVRFLDLHSEDLVGDLNRVLPGKLPAGFRPPEAEAVKDTLMVLQNAKAPATVGQLRTSSRYVGYVPTVVLISLVLATPLTWTRKGWALFWGLLWVHLFIAFRLTLTLTANGFAADKEYALFHPGPFWRAILTKMESVFADDPTVSFVVPVFLWFLVALRGRPRPSGAISNAT